MTGIEVIKEVRAVTGCTLKEAKDLFDNLSRKGVLKNTKPFSKGSSEMRNLFAGMAMIGFLADPNLQTNVIERSVILADELISELEK